MLSSPFVLHITLFSFFIRIVLPFLAIYLPADAMASSAEEGIVICTPHGVKVVDYDSFQNGSYLNKLDQYSSPENNTFVLYAECEKCFTNTFQLDDSVSIPIKNLVLAEVRLLSIVPVALAKNWLNVRQDYYFSRAPPSKNKS